MSILQKTINKDWKFHLGDCPTAWFKGYDDNGWTDVTLPHDWSVTEPFSKEHSSGGGYLSGGVGWYRTRFSLPKEAKEKKVWVVFDGVYNNSKVWVNSSYMGKRPYGYSTFAYDISDAASFGDNNTEISVRVNHKNTADSRWFTGSGITRKVSVIIKEPIYIDLNGVFFTSPYTSVNSAKVEVHSTLVNETQEESKAILRNSIMDTTGLVAAVMESSCIIPPGKAITVDQTGEVKSPLLWFPEEPNLYSLKTELMVNGKVMDQEITSVGIRSFKFDANKGFFLNDVNMKLKGVCLHHDGGCLGAAMLKKVWERRLKTLKKMGCNAIRMSHNPHMPELYELCDSMGFMVIDEAFDEWEGSKNKWSTGHNVYPPQLNGYFEDFPEWHEKDLEAMVKRDRNHPSVILWSIGNEIDYPNDPYCHPLFEDMTGNNDANKPSSERQYSPDRPNADRITNISKHLVALVKQWDITRPVTAAVAFPELSNITGYCDTLDVCGYNYKEQWYEEDHAKYPNRVLLGSENSSQYSTWKAVRDNDYISGQFLWTGIDYLGEAKGWPVHGSASGLLTTAGFEKPNYYFRQSLWAAQPMVQLVTARIIEGNINPHIRDSGDSLSWNYTQGEEINVKCYTNCPLVDILLNGVSQGIYKLTDFKEIGYISCKVIYQGGSLEARATAKDGSLITSTLSTAEAATAMVVEPDCTSIKANGEDIAQLIVTVVDGKGNWVPNATDMISVTIEGSAILLGLENGNLADNTDYTSKERQTCQGKLLIYIRTTQQVGPIKVTCSALGSLRESTTALRAE